MKHYIVLTAALMTFAGAAPAAMPQPMHIAPIPARAAMPTHVAQVSKPATFKRQFDPLKPCASTFSTCRSQPCPQPDLSQGRQQQAVQACDARGREPQATKP